MKVPLVLPSPVQQHLRRFSENFTRCLHDKICEGTGRCNHLAAKDPKLYWVRKRVGEKRTRTHDPIMRFQEFKKNSRTLLGVLGCTLMMTRPVFGSRIRS